MVFNTWYLIHGFVNFYIIFISITPILSIMRDPLLELFNPILYYDTTIVVDILHLYHILFFKCNKADIFHHLFFVTFGSLIVFIFNNGKFVALSHFFLCGLPGGIDYIYLFLYQCNYVSKLERLNMASFLNVWIRAPGLCMLSTFAILKFLYTKKTLYDFVEIILQVAMTYGNGQYYLREIVYTNGKYSLNNNSDRK